VLTGLWLALEAISGRQGIERLILGKISMDMYFSMLCLNDFFQKKK